MSTTTTKNTSTETSKPSNPVPQMRTIPNPFKDWCDVHGAYVMDETDGVCYFEDGSRVSGKDSPRLTSWTDPPVDPVRLLKAKRHYPAYKLSQEVKAFETYKKACISQHEYNRNNPAACPPPAADAASQLSAGKQRILALRKRVAVIDKQLADTSEGKNRQQANTTRSLSIRNANARINEIMQIDLND